MFDGGRDDISYNLYYQRADESGPPTLSRTVNITEGEITGLIPFTEYIVFVSAENGVSSQVNDPSGRSANDTLTTEEGRKFECERWKGGSVSFL